MNKKIMNFLRDENGQALSEYGLILGLIAVIAIGVLTALGGKIKEIFQSLVSALSGETTTP